MRQQQDAAAGGSNVVEGVWYAACCTIQPGVDAAAQGLLHSGTHSMPDKHVFSPTWTQPHGDPGRPPCPRTAARAGEQLFLRTHCSLPAAAVLLLGAQQQWGRVSAGDGYGGDAVGGWGGEGARVRLTGGAICCCCCTCSC